ncbi:PLC-like phosphodiesterase [Atractiella rhizophila]|nr:PLC-like phosphodiesterase [Atractiella rhizophila]
MLPLLLLLPSLIHAQQLCNLYSDYCSRSYSNVTHIGAHDSFAVHAGSVAANQLYDVSTQLDNGIRMLQGQGHWSNNELRLCHTSCGLLDGGTLEDYLTKVKTWLDANPNEVVSLLWVNSDDRPCTDWRTAYQNTGLINLSYVPASTPIAKKDWPTLAEMISSGKRVVSYLDNSADYSSCPELLDEFSTMWETPFNEVDASFPCTKNRTNKAIDPSMYLMNHYLDTTFSLSLGTTPTQVYIPATDQLNKTNAATGVQSIGEQVDACVKEWGAPPTFVLVDFYHVVNGSVFQAAANINGVSYVARQVGNGTESSSTSTSGGSGSSGGSSNDNSAAAGRRTVGFAALMGLLGIGLGALV